MRQSVGTKMKALRAGWRVTTWVARATFTAAATLVTARGLTAQAARPASPKTVAPARASAQTPLAFREVTVIDMVTGQLQPEQTVVIVGNRIQALGPTATVPLPPGTRVVAARGKYLIPGFWDMELSLGAFSKPLMQLLIANGVTGYRNLGSYEGTIGGEKLTIDSLLRWRREVVAGERIGPRVLIGGRRVSDLGCPMDSTGQVSSCTWTPERARFLVDSLQAAGADHIFFYESLPQAVVFALLAEARQRHIPVVGHLPGGLTLVEASDSGFHAFDHLGLQGTEGICRMDSATRERCDTLVTRLRRNKSWLVFGPTATLNPPCRFVDLGPWVAEQERRRQAFPRQLRGAPPSPEREQFEVQQVCPRERQYDLRLFEQTHAPLLIGADQGADGGAAGIGFSLQDALATVVEHGLTPLTALQAATWNAAQYLEGTDSLGTVAVGKLADVILLDADPLADINNTRTIRAVVADGRYYDRAALDRMLREAGRFEVDCRSFYKCTP